MLTTAVMLLMQVQQGPQGDLATAMARWVADSQVVALAVADLEDGGTGAAIVRGPLVAGSKQHGGLRTLFEIGSITKAITGTLLADMVRRGEVALDDPVAQHLPTDWTVPQVGDRPITLLDLATHTSGLPRMPAEFTPEDPENPYADVDLAALRDFLAAAKPARAPGTSYEYSNLGFAVLGQALAHAGGKSWLELVRERVLLPLGMRDTWLEVRPADAGRFAAGHNSRFIAVPHWDLGAFAPAGGLRSTVVDMSRLAAALKMPADTGVTAGIILATTGFRALGSGTDSVGLGWHIRNRDGSRIAWHNGGTGGFRTWVGSDRGRDRGAVVLANAIQPWVDALGVALVLDDTLPEPPPVAQVRVVSVPAAQLEPLVGRYVLNPAFVMEISHEGDTLHLQATNQPRIRMVATSPLEFAATVVDASITFERDASGRIVALVLHQGGTDQRAPRAP